MPPTAVKELAERYALAIENVNQRLDRSEKFQDDVRHQLATISSDMRRIKGIGAFLGGAVLAWAGAVVSMSNRADHVEEAVSTLQHDVKTLQGDVKNFQGDVKTLQGDSTGNMSLI